MDSLRTSSFESSADHPLILTESSAEQTSLSPTKIPLGTPVPIKTRKIHSLPSSLENSNDVDSKEEEAFFASARKVPRKRKVAEIFSKFDDLYAQPFKVQKTADQLFKDIMSQINDAPKTPVPSIPYRTELEKTARKEAYLKEQRNYLSRCKHLFDTPVKTPNVSGVQSLDSPDSRPLTPIALCLSSQTRNIPEEIKANILLGVRCFVDVRHGKENRSAPVKQQLLSLGAKVDRTLTNKVEIVVFKEGLVTTYFKAQDLGLTLVSTFWIEACKVARSKVDPSLYPPMDMSKYERILPFEVKTRRKRIKVPKKKKDEVSINDRNALTDTKQVSKLFEKDSQPACGKKLDFGSNFQKHDESDDSFPIINLSDLPKRASAPGCLDKKKRKKPEIIDLTDSMEKINKKTEKATIPKDDCNKIVEKETATIPKEDCMNKMKEKPKTDENKEEKPIRKRKALFNPQWSLSDLETGNLDPKTALETKTTTPVVSYLDQILEKPTSKKSSKKKPNVTKNKPKTNLIKPRSILDAFKEDDEDTFASSIALFATKKTPSKIYRPPTIVFTSFNGDELKDCEEIIKKLGVFEVEKMVTKYTTHVVSKGPRRTVNLLKGLSRGCWIVDVEWLHKSNSAGTYVMEDNYELTSFSMAVMYNRLEKNAFKDEYSKDLFSTAGLIYVSLVSVPSNSDMSELITLCGGKLTKRSTEAQIIIGGTAKNGQTNRVKETWILDSIQRNTMLNIDDYKY